MYKLMIWLAHFCLRISGDDEIRQHWLDFYRFTPKKRKFKYLLCMCVCVRMMDLQIKKSKNSKVIIAHMHLFIVNIHISMKYFRCVQENW